MIRPRFFVAVLAASLGVLGATALAAQQQAIGSGIGTFELDPRVRASVVDERMADESASRAILVILWRGQPGWMSGSPAGTGGVTTAEGASTTLRTGAPGVSGPDSTDSTDSTDSWTVSHEEPWSGVDLSWRFRPGLLRVLGREIPVAPHAVVLIDRADGVGGPPEVIGIDTARVELDEGLWEQGGRPADRRARREQWRREVRAALQERPRIRAFLAGEVVPRAP